MANIDVRKLIREVQKREVLYNTSSDSYTNTEVRHRKWMEVANVMGSNVHECKRKWKMLRDVFSKDVRLEKALDPHVYQKRKKYIYYDDMSFLIPFLKRKTNSFNGYESSKGDCVSSEGFTEEEMVVVHNDDTSDEKYTYLEIPCYSVEETVNADNTDFEQKVVDVLQKHLSEVNEDLEQKVVAILEKNGQIAYRPKPSEDELFFQSLLPTFSQLSPERKSLLKVQISQLVHNAAFEHDKNSNYS